MIHGDQIALSGPFKLWRWKVNMVNMALIHDIAFRIRTYRLRSLRT